MKVTKKMVALAAGTYERTVLAGADHEEAWEIALRSVFNLAFATKQPENQQMFALIRDRDYDGEGLTLWTWNGENYSGSDGDCLTREPDGTLGGFVAEFVTDHQLEQRLNSAWQAAEHQALERAAQQWIRVDERMPPEETHVLAAVQFDHANDWRIKVGGIHEGKWQIFGGSWTPSHWMPLPEAPASTVASKEEKS